MKKIIIFFILPIFGTLYANELEWVTQQIQEIKPKRVGINNDDIKKLKNPFITIKYEKPLNSSIKYNKSDKIKKKHRYIPVLNGIMNKSVLLNNRWYKIGEVVNNYKIIKISNNFAILKKHDREFKISTLEKKKSIKIKREIKLNK